MIISKIHRLFDIRLCSISRKTISRHKTYPSILSCYFFFYMLMSAFDKSMQFISSSAAATRHLKCVALRSRKPRGNGGVIYPPIPSHNYPNPVAKLYYRCENTRFTLPTEWESKTGGILSTSRSGLSASHNKCT